MVASTVWRRWLRDGLAKVVTRPPSGDGGYGTATVVVTWRALRLRALERAFQQLNQFGFRRFARVGRHQTLDAERFGGDRRQLAAIHTKLAQL